MDKYDLANEGLKFFDGYAPDKRAVAKAHGIKNGFIKFGGKEEDPDTFQAYEIARLIKAGVINRADLPMLVERGVSKKAAAHYIKNRPRIESEISPSVAGFNKYEFKQLSMVLKAMDPKSEEYKVSKKLEQEAIAACVEYIKGIKPRTIRDEEEKAEEERRKQLLEKYGPAVPIDKWVENWMSPGLVAVNIKGRHDIYKETGKWPEDTDKEEGPGIPFEYLPELSDVAKTLGLHKMAQTAFNFEHKRAKHCGGEEKVREELGNVIPDLFYKKGPIGSDSSVQVEFKKVRKFDQLPNIKQRQMYNMKQFEAACDRYVNDICQGDELKKIAFLKNLKTTLLKPRRMSLKSYRTNGANETEVYFNYFVGLIDDKMNEKFPPKPKIVEKRSWISKFFNGLKAFAHKLFEKVL